MQIEVDDAVKEHVLREKHDFRICTACLGPARVQAPYIDRITADMIYDEVEIDSCPAFYAYTDKKRHSH